MDEPDSPNGADTTDADGWYGWQVGANRDAHAALDAARMDPEFRELEATLPGTGMTKAEFDRQIFEAQRDGRVTTMINGRWPEQPDQTDTPALRPRREIG